MYPNPLQPDPSKYPNRRPSRNEPSRITKQCADCGALIWRDKPTDLCDPCAEPWLALRDLYQQGGISDWQFFSQPDGMARKAPAPWQVVTSNAVAAASYRYQWPLGSDAD